MKRGGERVVCNGMDPFSGKARKCDESFCEKFA